MVAKAGRGQCRRLGTVPKGLRRRPQDALRPRHVSGPQTRSTRFGCAVVLPRLSHLAAQYRGQEAQKSMTVVLSTSPLRQESP